MQQVVAPDSLTHQQLALAVPPESYYRARYYDPSVGRFISEDPTQFAAGNNFYVYTFNRAANATDPTGLDCRTWVVFVTCTNDGDPASILAAQRAHELQHVRDNLFILYVPTLVFAQPGPSLWGLIAPKISNSACVFMERRGYAREVPILEKRIAELSNKKCLTDAEKNELAYLNEELQTALNILTNWSVASDYCHAGPR